MTGTIELERNYLSSSMAVTNYEQFPIYSFLLCKYTPWLPRLKTNTNTFFYISVINIQYSLLILFVVKY